MAEIRKKNPFSEHLFEYRNVEKKKLSLSLSITAIVMIIEIIGSILTNSIALLSDAGHMFTHTFAISISLIAILIAKKPPCHHRTFGLYRAEVLAAFINGLFLLFVVVIIIYEAIQRLINPEEVLGYQMLFIAFIGLFVNMLSIAILHGSHKKNMNIRGVFYHMISDAVSSIGIILAAIIILLTGWNIIDPLVSLLISGLILYWAWGILKESSRVLLETAPKGLNVDIIGNDLKNNFSEIKNFNNMHLWTITPEIFRPKYNIIESTIQISTDVELITC